MSRQIIKQPNGLYAIWCTIVDELIYKDITIKEYIKIRVKEEARRIKRDVMETLNQLNNGQKPYCQFTMTYKEALKETKRTRNEKF